MKLPFIHSPILETLKPFVPSACHPPLPSPQLLSSAHSTSPSVLKPGFSSCSSLHCCGPGPGHLIYCNRQSGISQGGGQRATGTNQSVQIPLNLLCMCVTLDMSLTCSIICKKGILTITCENQQYKGPRTEASPRQVFIKCLFPSLIFPHTNLSNTLAKLCLQIISPI